MPVRLSHFCKYEDKLKVFEGILHGIDIVSSDVESYKCENYRSILELQNKKKWIE